MRFLFKSRILFGYRTDRPSFGISLFFRWLLTTLLRLTTGESVGPGRVLCWHIVLDRLK